MHAQYKRAFLHGKQTKTGMGPNSKECIVIQRPFGPVGEAGEFGGDKKVRNDGRVRLGFPVGEVMTRLGFEDCYNHQEELNNRSAQI